MPAFGIAIGGAGEGPAPKNQEVASFFEELFDGRPAILRKAGSVRQYEQLGRSRSERSSKVFRVGGRRRAEQILDLLRGRGRGISGGKTGLAKRDDSTLSGLGVSHRNQHQANGNDRENDRNSHALAP